MGSITTNFGDVLLWSFWLFIWLAALMLWFRCLIHLFQDGTLSGWSKAGWVILLDYVLVPDAFATQVASMRAHPSMAFTYSRSEEHTSELQSQ